MAPLSFMTWNVNGLTSRIKLSGQWTGFVNLAKQHQPDILCFQEVKLAAHSPIGAKRYDGQPREPSKLKRNEKGYLEEAEMIGYIISTDFPDYQRFWSLSEWRYSGQLMLIRNSLKEQVNEMRYNIDFNLPPSKHSKDGRAIIADFNSWIFISTYTPNNGSSESHFERRESWDIQLEEFFGELYQKGKKIIWTGDLNCAPEDSDLSDAARLRAALPDLKDPDEFRKWHDIRDYMGYPGCTNMERDRFQSVLKAGYLVDVYKELSPRSSNVSTDAPAFTWRGHPGRFADTSGKFLNKAMRLDHFIVSSSLLPSVQRIEILGYHSSRVNFFGSDHCPVVLYLKDIA